MVTPRFNVGILDNRFLARSIGYLNPKPPIEVNTTATLREVIDLLATHKVGCVVIVGQKGEILGIFSDRDLVTKVAGKPVDIEVEVITKYMTPKPETTEMTTTIAFVLNMMSKGEYHHVPIVDEMSKPVGMIGVKDIVDYLVNEMDREIDKMIGLE